MNRVHAGDAGGPCMLVPLLCAGILAVMLQQVVAVPVIGRALVLLFNVIPWAGEKGNITRPGDVFMMICSFHCLHRSGPADSSHHWWVHRTGGIRQLGPCTVGIWGVRHLGAIRRDQAEHSNTASSPPVELPSHQLRMEATCSQTEAAAHHSPRCVVLSLSHTPVCWPFRLPARPVCSPSF